MGVLSDIKNASKREWYWLLESGKSIKKGNISNLRSENFNNIPAPIFFLSTGRTGTAWFANLFSKQKALMVFHDPQPNLAVQNKFYYNFLQKKKIDKDCKIEVGKEIFLAAREEYLIYSYKTNKQFVETNNQPVFFAESIAKLLPNSKFVHLYRHPGEFVRSGLRRNWYSNDNNSILKLIEPLNNPLWKEYSQIEKISWLWTVTNEYIEEFKVTLESNRVIDFNFNELSVENILKLSRFIETDISPKQIEKRLNKKLNVQNKGEFKKYSDWSEIDKTQLKNICGTLAEKYGYSL